MAFKLSMIVGLIFLSATLTLATPVKLTLQPKGTNQIQLTFGSVTPGGWYQVLVRTNGPDGHWITLSSFLAGSNKTFSVTAGLGGVQGLKTESLSNWNFVAGEWNDSEGDELPMIYKELVLRIDPYASGDPYGNPMGDGWNNLQKMQNNMDPYKWYTPPPPSQSSVRFVAGMNGSRKGSAVLAWQIWNGPVPDYFVIERANRTPRPNPNPFPIHQPGQPFNRTNYFAYNNCFTNQCRRVNFYNDDDFACYSGALHLISWEQAQLYLRMGLLKADALRQPSRIRGPPNSKNKSV